MRQVLRNLKQFGVKRSINIKMRRMKLKNSIKSLLREIFLWMKVIRIQPWKNGHLKSIFK